MRERYIECHVLYPCAWGSAGKIAARTIVLPAINPDGSCTSCIYAQQSVAVANVLANLPVDIFAQRLLIKQPWREAFRLEQCHSPILGEVGTLLH